MSFAFNKHWVVDVYGYDPIIVEASSKGAARFKAYRLWNEAWGLCSFRDFLARGVVVQRSEYR
jgi:hypothetical protein